MKKIIFIKFGGSVITDKNSPLSPSVANIKNLATQLAHVQAALSHKYYFVVGNGAGSYGHYYADKYKTTEGIQTEKQIEGFAVEQYFDTELNHLILKNLIDSKIHAQSFHPSSMFFVVGGKVKKVFMEPLIGTLNLGITPCLYGNIVFDKDKGCHILSTEVIFNQLIKQLLRRKYQIAKVVYVTTVDGFKKQDGTTIQTVNKENYPALKKHFYHTKGFDVTGGMKQKITEALKLAGKGVRTQIVNGNDEDILIKALIENRKIGTLVT